MLLQLNNNPFRSEKSKPVQAHHHVISGGAAYEYLPQPTNIGRRSLQLSHSSQSLVKNTQGSKAQSAKKKSTSYGSNKENKNFQSNKSNKALGLYNQVHILTSGTTCGTEADEEA